MNVYELNRKKEKDEELVIGELWLEDKHNLVPHLITDVIGGRSVAFFCRFQDSLNLSRYIGSSDWIK